MLALELQRMSKEEKIKRQYKSLVDTDWRIQDERMSILLLSKFLEKAKDVMEWDLAFRKPNESPDGMLFVKTKEGNEYYLNVEFEGYSRNFENPHKWLEHCDLIVCTLHNWEKPTVPVLEIQPDGTYQLFAIGEGTKGSFYEFLRSTSNRERT